MRSKKSHTLVALALASILAGAAGCSVVGFTVGTLADLRRPRERVVPPASMPSLHRGARLSIVMRDSSRVEGRFTGMAMRPTGPGTESREGNEAGRWLLISPSPKGQSVSLGAVPTTMSLPVDSVSHVTARLAPRSSYGFFIGLAIDVAALGLILATHPLLSHYD